MTKGRTEAFSDAVIAIIITIMVLELKAPLGEHLEDLWANLHLLFWLSLIPFVTSWIGESHFAPAPTALYGGVLLLAAIAYYILQGQILRNEGPQSLLATAIGRDLKGKLSPVIYAIAMPLAFLRPWIAGALYAGVALIWFIPDQRIERVLMAHADAAN